MRANGLLLNWKYFAHFAQTLGFKHAQVTPLWPRANREVECFMQTIKKTSEAAKLDHQPWKEAVWPAVQLKSLSPGVDRCTTSNSTVQPADAHQDATGYAYTVCPHKHHSL